MEELSHHVRRDGASFSSLYQLIWRQCEQQSRSDLYLTAPCLSFLLRIRHLKWHRLVNRFVDNGSDWSWPRMCSASTLWWEDSQNSSLFRERYWSSQIGSHLSLGGNQFLRRIAMPGMITVVISSETWRREWGWLALQSLFDWSSTGLSCFSVLSYHCIELDFAL